MRRRRTSYSRYQHESKRLTPVTVVCALLFLLFSFSWLFWFQGDLLAIVQHGLSEGKTHYDRTIGAVIITGILFALQLFVLSLTGLTRRTHALTYLPSFLLLAFVSSLHVPFTWGAWLWAGPSVLLLWGIGVWLARQVLPLGDEGRYSAGFLSRQMWLNLLQMAAMMLAVAAIGNTNAVEHYKARMERALAQGHVEEALVVGERSLETDESLTMLRIYALSRRGQLADRLFEYAVSGTSGDMLPLRGSHSRLALMADTLLWQHFGLSPDSIVARSDSTWQPDSIAGRTYRGRIAFADRFTVSQYLDSLEHDTLATAAHRDYRLMGQLIDCQIDTFAATLPRYYPLRADTLPRHYREALVLYQQLRDTSFIYEDTLMLSRWRQFVSYDSICPLPSERQLRTEGEFRGTYWYYFQWRATPPKP